MPTAQYENRNGIRLLLDRLLYLVHQIVLYVRRGVDSLGGSYTMAGVDGVEGAGADVQAASTSSKMPNTVNNWVL